MLADTVVREGTEGLYFLFIFPEQLSLWLLWRCSSEYKQLYLHRDSFWRTVWWCCARWGRAGNGAGGEKRAPSWLKQGAENWRTIPALWLNRCQERRYHCASVLRHGAAAMQVSACVSGQAERENRPRPTLYCDLKTGKFSETELNRWLREPAVITVACYKLCSVHVDGERPFILAINQ